MNRVKLHDWLIYLCCLLFCLCCSSSNTAKSAPPKNVIFFIGDGMGFEQVKAAGFYANGQEGTLSFEYFPYQGQLTTYSADFEVTDSAAAATAIATAQKVNNGVISVALPGQGQQLQTLLELFKDQGKITGLLTTTYISHATPAAFGAHEPSRGNYNEIVDDYLTQTRPNLLFGGTRTSADAMTQARAASAGYTVVTDRASLQALDTDLYTNQSNTFISGQFPGPSGHMPYEDTDAAEYDTLPHLAEMTAVALDILDNDPDGFFLMVEGGRIDHAGHSNNLQDNVSETIAFANAVQQAVNWAAGRTDTLIVIIADHETGGLTVLQNNTQGSFPTVSWSTTGHTAVNVPLFAWGANAELIKPVTDNTELFAVATAVPGNATGDGFIGADDNVQVLTFWGYSSPPQPLPEPASLSLMILAGLALTRRDSFSSFCSWKIGGPTLRCTRIRTPPWA